jgi:hypothetical protein
LDTCIKDAADQFNVYFDLLGRSKANVSAFEIMTSQFASMLYDPLQIKGWSEQCPPELAGIYSKLAMPDVFVGIGDLQIQSADTGDITSLLQSFQGQNAVMLFLSMGYAFGVHCRLDGKFVVFDTHRKSFQECPIQGAAGIKYKSGAYAVLISGIEETTAFIDDFTLDNRKAILSMGEPGQDQSASAIQICIVCSPHIPAKPNNGERPIPVETKLTIS